MPSFQVKVREPDAYDGTGDYEEWSEKLMGYMALENPKYLEVMQNYESMPTAMTDEEMTMHYDDEFTEDDEKILYLARKLYHMIQQLTTGPAYTVVRTVRDYNGFEAHRQLTKRYARTKSLTTISSLVSAVNTKFEEATFEQQLATWELHISDYERASGDVMNDKLKIALLVANTSGTLHQHLCLHVNAICTYMQVRDMIVNYLKTKTMTLQPTSSTKPSRQEPTPMEVDALKAYKGKGKGKWWKGKAKGGRDYKGSAKGDSKGKGPPEEIYHGKGYAPEQKWCDYCQRAGHSTDECWHVEDYDYDQYENYYKYYQKGGYETPPALDRRVQHLDADYAPPQQSEQQGLRAEASAQQSQPKGLQVSGVRSESDKPVDYRKSTRYYVMGLSASGKTTRCTSSSTNPSPLVGATVREGAGGKVGLPKGPINVHGRKPGQTYVMALMKNTTCSTTGPTPSSTGATGPEGASASPSVTKTTAITGEGRSDYYRKVTEKLLDYLTHTEDDGFLQFLSHYAYIDNYMEEMHDTSWKVPSTCSSPPSSRPSSASSTRT